MNKLNTLQNTYLIYGYAYSLAFRYIPDQGDYFIVDDFISPLPCNESHPEMYHGANHKSSLRFIKKKIDTDKCGQIEYYMQEGDDQLNRNNHWYALRHFNHIVEKMGFSSRDELVEYLNSRPTSLNLV